MVLSQGMLAFGQLATNATSHPPESQKTFDWSISVISGQASGEFSNKIPNRLPLSLVHKGKDSMLRGEMPFPVVGNDAPTLLMLAHQKRVPLVNCQAMLFKHFILQKLVSRADKEEFRSG